MAINAEMAITWQYKHLSNSEKEYGIIGAIFTKYELSWLQCIIIRLSGK
jgi:hypothetical protein